MNMNSDLKQLVMAVSLGCMGASPAFAGTNSLAVGADSVIDIADFGGFHVQGADSVSVQVDCACNHALHFVFSFVV